MLMDHSEETSHGNENAKRTMFLDLERSYGHKTGGLKSNGSNALKRKLGSEGKNGVRKRSKKEVLSSNLSSGGKSKGNGKVGRGKLSSSADSRKSELGAGNRSGGCLGGISLSLNSNVKIPKRPRDLVRRKKVELNVGSKQEGKTSGRSSTEGGSRTNSCSNGSLLHNGNGNGKLAQNGESEGGATGGCLAKVKRKKNSNDHKENRSRGSDLLRHLKREHSHTPVNNHNSLTKKARRNNKKKKTSRSTSPGVGKETKKVLDESSRICDDSQDDEENLEANAARMLSSRFDPSCTGFSSGGKCSKLLSADGLSALISSSGDLASAEPIFRAEDIGSGVAEVRVLQPKDQQKEKGLSLKRRHFYEVLSRELDSYWVVNRRIKVFWPLDQSWYIGHVIGYDPEKKLHHIKYDDRDEEWIDLHNERFKLLLLPSEVTGKVRRKKSRIRDNNEIKGKHGESADKEGNSNSSMESEPIISWFARSARRKSPPFKVTKKQKTLNETAKSEPASFSGGKTDARGSLEVGPSGRNADDCVCSSALPEKTCGSLRVEKPLTENFISHNNKPPIVYYRRRFRRREQSPGNIRGEELYQLFDKAPVCRTAPQLTDFLHLDADMLDCRDRFGYYSKRLCPDELIWNTDDSGFLKLSIPVPSLKVFRFEIRFPQPGVIKKLFGGQNFMFMLQHGTLISLWPMVHLEILFVDNVAGLRFLLYEGCLKTAVFFVFLVMTVLHRSNQKEISDQQLRVTSIRFRLSGLRDHQRQLVFPCYNFNEVANSKWSYLDRKLNRHCLITKQLPPSEGTYNNFNALHNDFKQLPLSCVSRLRSSVMSLWKRSRQHKMKNSSEQSICLMLSRLSQGSDEKQGNLPAFALSFAAAPGFFCSLHLKLLMERSIPSSSFGEQDPVVGMNHSGNDNETVGIDRFLVENNPVGSSLSVESKSGFDGASIKPSHASQYSVRNEADVSLHLEKRKAPLSGTEHAILSAEQLDANYQLLPAEASMGCGPLSGMTIEIPSCDPVEKDAVVCSPDPTSAKNIKHPNRVGSSSASVNLSPPLSDGKQDFLHVGFGSGPKKPRTHVSYSMPFEGHDHNSRNKLYHPKGFSHKRIRRASEKKTSEAFGTTQIIMELLSCDANVLVTTGDRGWRECGARVGLELVDHNDWRLVVKVSGDSKYSYKAHQFLQPGTTNRYTHAMMWKGEKDWILEFPDRPQWTTFKEMHEECYNRNLRAASVKNIPIPGVRLVEENDDNVPEVPFVRPSPKYYRQMETDVDIAMDPSRVLYDMDSDDERWIAKHRDLYLKSCEDLSDEVFQKAMDVFEKVAYAKKCDNFSSEEFEKDMAGLGPPETIKVILEHWREKRQRKGMPLLRHLQPPLWERYQQQVKEWEQEIMKCNAVVSNGCHEKPFTIEKPPTFAFCLKPRGLEVSIRGLKHRSQKKLPVGALGNVISADSDAFHSLVGRRLNWYGLGDERVIFTSCNQGTSDSSPVLQGSTRVLSPRDAMGVGYLSLSSDGSERNNYPKLYRNKPKKLCFMSPSNDNEASASYNQRTMAKRSAVHGWNMSSSEWQSQMCYSPEGYQGYSFEKLDPSEFDEFRLRDAASAVRHAVTIAKMKRENAQRMLCRADLAMHKAVAAIMTADAVVASYKQLNSDTENDG